MFRARLVPLTALALLTMAWMAWSVWPNDQRQIRRRLNALASVYNEQAADGLAVVARTAQMAQFFTEDVVVEPGRGAPPILGRERLVALAARVPAGRQQLAFVDVSIHVAGESATTDMTASLSTEEAETGRREVDAREVALEWRRGQEWQISRVRVVETLERP